MLKILQKHYHGKIKMIYIDPPYNTGKDFVYKDNYTEGVQSYLEQTQQWADGKKLTSNSESEGRYHSNWLNMMYPRLKLARNLLTDDGVIFVSISEHEVGQLRKLMDELYFDQNFLAQFVVRTSGGRQDSEYFAQNHEYLICFAKKIQTFVAGRITKESQGFNKVDASTGRKYKTQLLRKWGDNSRRADRPNLYYSITTPDGDDFYPMVEPGVEGCWRWSKDRMTLAIKNGQIEWTVQGGDWVPYEKVFEPEEGEQNTKPYSTLIEVAGSGSKETKALMGAKYFDYPKSVGLISELIRMAHVGSNEIVLDFFAGSGTTGHAVMVINAEDGGSRRWIQVQLPEPTPGDSVARAEGFETVSAITRTRLSLAAAKIESESSDQLSLRESALDLGFRAFKLADTNFSKWRVESEVDEARLAVQLEGLRDSANDDATADDLLTEILLKQGYSLTEQIASVEIAGLELRSVGEGVVLAYLNEHVKPTLEQLREVVAAEPSKLIVLEDAFHGDDELKTNTAQLCKSKGIELWTA